MYSDSRPNTRLNPLLALNSLGGNNKAISQIWYQVSQSVFKFVFMHNLRLLFDLPILPKWDPHLVPTCCDWAGHWADF